MDPVIQIASLVTVQGDKSPVVKNILTLNDCAQIIGAEVMSFNTERELLNRWRVRRPFLHLLLSTALDCALCPEFALFFFSFFILCMPSRIHLFTLPLLHPN